MLEVLAAKLTALATERRNERVETDVKKRLVECEGRELKEISYLEDYCIPVRQGSRLLRIFTAIIRVSDIEWRRTGKGDEGVQLTGCGKNLK